MRRQQFSVPNALAPEERAFFLQLSAMNAAFEAARAGDAARAMAERAAGMDELLDRYFHALTSSDAAPQQPT